jgi:hypothetical protein
VLRLREGREGERVEGMNRWGLGFEVGKLFYMIV